MLVGAATGTAGLGLGLAGDWAGTVGVVMAMVGAVVSLANTGACCLASLTIKFTACGVGAKAKATALPQVGSNSSTVVMINA